MTFARIRLLRDTGDPFTFDYPYPPSPSGWTDQTLFTPVNSNSVTKEFQNPVTESPNDMGLLVLFVS